MLRIAIEGASGYSGMELTRILERHPQASLVAVSSGRWAGRTIGQVVGLSGRIGGLLYTERIDADVDGVFLATPAGVSRELAPIWLKRGAIVVDLSDAYRADPGATYAVTELHRTRVAGSRLIANPGCYPTAALLALVPLIEAGLVDEGPVIIDAKSGVTGAGRKLDDSLLFNELMDNHYPYRVGEHQHVPEIERVLGRKVLFTPHLLPTRRGILVSAYVRVKGGVEPKELRDCLQALLSALERGVRSAQIIDGRVSHNLLAELFTDQGVGTMVEAT